MLWMPWDIKAHQSKPNYAHWCLPLTHWGWVVHMCVSNIWIKIQPSSYRKFQFSAKWYPFCLHFNILMPLYTGSTHNLSGFDTVNYQWSEAFGSNKAWSIWDFAKMDLFTSKSQVWNKRKWQSILPDYKKINNDFMMRNKRAYCVYLCGCHASL